MALAAGLLTAACGSKDSNQDDIAKAFAGPPAPDSKKETEAKMKALKQRAEADAQKARDDELEKITTAPSVLPELEAGCTEAAAGLDEFKQKRLAADADELARWNATKEPDLRKIIDACRAAGKPELAACQANAWRNAGLANFGIDAEQELLDACTKRYGAATPTPVQ